MVNILLNYSFRIQVFFTASKNIQWRFGKHKSHLKLSRFQRRSPGRLTPPDVIVSPVRMVLADVKIFKQKPPVRWLLFLPFLFRLLIISAVSIIPERKLYIAYYTATVIIWTEHFLLFRHLISPKIFGKYCGLGVYNL